MSTAERRLSAIMFTDIVGYSTITQINEETALRLLQEHRAILRPIFIKYNGNEIKTIGDAFLVEFQSALLAVKCAIEIQRELKTRNSFLDTKEHIWLRIGLHIGDVVFQHNDVYGDGVNFASRIHAQAPPGGICISRAVYEQIANKIDEKIKKQRSQKLKSIEKPVQLFLIELDKKQHSRRVIPYLIAGVIGVCVILGLSFLVYQSFRNSDTAAVTDKDASDKVDTLKNLKPTIVDSTLTTDQINNEPINEPITNTQPSIPSITTNEPRVKPEASFTGDANWRGLVDRYQPITVAGSWNELQRKLTIYRDSGLFGVYASESTVPIKTGSLVAILDANATSTTTIEAYLIYTDSGFKNVASEEKITNLNARYPGRRQIWIRSLK